jgi:hypothetical protein
MLRPVRCVQHFTVPCSSIRKGVRKLRKQLRQPHTSSRRARTHSDPSSTLGSSPGVVEKRILGVFSLCTSDGTMSSSVAFGGGHRWWAIWIIRLSPSSGSMNHQTRTCGAGLFVSLHFLRRHKIWGSGTPRAGPQRLSSGLWRTYNARSCKRPSENDPSRQLGE